MSLLKLQNFLLSFCILTLLLLAQCFSAHAENGLVSSIRFDSKGKRLAVGKDNGSVSVWDITEKRLLWSSSINDTSIYNIFFRNNDSQVLASELLGNIRVYNTDSGRLIKTIRPDFLGSYGGMEDRLRAADLDSSGRILALSGVYSDCPTLVDLNLSIDKSDQTDLRLKDFMYIAGLRSGLTISLKSPKGKSPGVIESVCMGSNPRYTDIRLCPDGKYLVATTESGLLVVWNIEPLTTPSEKQSKVLSPEPYIRKIGSSQDSFKALLGLACSKTGFIMSVGYHSRKYGQIQLWKTETGEMIHYISDAHPGTARRVTFDRAGRLAVTTGDILYNLWAIRNEKLYLLCKIFFGRFAGLDDLPNAVDFSPTQAIMAIGDTSDIFLFDISTFKIIGNLGNTSRELKIRCDVNQPK